MTLYSGDLRAYARQRLAGRWTTAVGVSLVAFLMGGLSGESSGSSGGSWRAGDSWLNDASPATIAILGTLLIILGVWLLITAFIGPATELGHKAFYIKLCREEPVGFADLFSRFSCFWKAFGLRFMMVLLVALWSLLLVIPGIIAAFRYAMAPYIMAEDPDIGVMDALAESKRMMHGRKMDLFVLGLSFLGWHLLGILTLGIGFLFVTPYYETARAAFYLNVSQSG